MSLLNLFNRKANLIGDVPIDVLRSWGTPLEAEVTEHPVESEIDVSDHRRIRPQFLSLDCIFTSFDTTGPQIANAARGAPMATATWQDKRDRLHEIFNDNELIGVAIPDGDYTNMTITSIRPDNRVSTANAYFCTIELKKIKLITSETAAVDPSSVPKDVRKQERADQKAANDKKQEEQNLGTKQGKDANKQQKSVLVGLYDATIGK